MLIEEVLLCIFWLGHNYRRAGEMLASFCGAFDVPLVLLILTQVK